MKKAEIAVGLIVAIFAGNAWAQVYRCEKNGKVLYTDKRCKNAERIQIDTIDPDRAAQAAKALEQIEQQHAEEREKEREAARERAEEAEFEETQRRAEIEKQRQVEQIRRDMRFPGRVYHYNVP